MQSNATDEEIKRELADIIASISIIIGDDGDTLKYFILGSKILTGICIHTFQTINIGN